MSASGESGARPSSREANATVAVVGGGLVGALQAVLLAQRGLSVELFEARADIRASEHVSGRSINLALSLRGREALRAVGLELDVLAAAIPMRARMIHSVKGGLSAHPYGERGECIYSVDRRRLNELLLTRAEECARVRLHFRHQLTRANLEEKTLQFVDGSSSSSSVGQSAEAVGRPSHKEVRADFIFGCDGAHSTVRRQMMRWGRLNYSQEYIEHGYKELTMPPNARGEFAMARDYLHIWPRNEFMMIALPNQDRSFTLTLFMPFKIFESLETEEELLAFFMRHFPDSVEKVGVDRLCQDYFGNPTGRLISVKCFPHYMARSTLILGDAAHAVVPFYGQGMNAGFEDCLVFYELLGESDGDLCRAALEYSRTRWRDSHAIADLSMYNYLEMRSHVNSRAYIARRIIDKAIHYLFPSHFVPLYTMVAFTRMPYHDAVRRNRRQRRLVNGLLWLLGLSALGLVGFAAYARLRSRIPISYRVMPCVAQCFICEYRRALSS